MYFLCKYSTSWRYKKPDAKFTLLLKTSQLHDVFNDRFKFELSFKFSWADDYEILEFHF
jgi:hypothetical protein